MVFDEWRVSSPREAVVRLEVHPVLSGCGYLQKKSGRIHEFMSAVVGIFNS
jgi:hypothetical protein